MIHIKKFLVALLGFVVIVLTTILSIGPEVIPTNLLVWVQIVLGVGTAYGVYAVKNVPYVYPSDATNGEER